MHLTNRCLPQVYASCVLNKHMNLKQPVPQCYTLDTPFISISAWTVFINAGNIDEGKAMY